MTLEPAGADERSSFDDHPSLGEEIANSITHGAGAVGAIIAVPWLAINAAFHGDAWRLVTSVVFAVSALVLFTASTLYHALPPGGAKRVFRVLDHSAIYVLIAGTYTPFTVGLLGGGWGWSLFGVVWSVAVLGVVFKSTLRFRFPIASTILYVGLGWIALVGLQPLLRVVTRTELIWLLAGGVFYTAGVPFYALRRRYSHALWHLFVLAGAACHFVAVLSLTYAR